MIDTATKISTVAVVTVRGSVQKSVREAMELASWRDCLQKDKPTCLKVNFGWDLFIPGSVTSPWVIEGVIQTIQGWVGPLYVVESDQILENVEKAFRKLRLQELLDRYGVKWLNMSRIRTIKVAVPGGKIFTELEIPDILMESQLITVPVMKTHAKTRITGAIKNQWGCISKLRHNYHLVLDEALADINTVMRPAFAVLDATIALEGNGPKSGHPRIVNRVLASSDIVAIDTVQAKLMGLDPSAIPHLKACSDRNLGILNIRQIMLVGDEDADSINFHFRSARHNLVSRVEELLRRSKLRKLVFDTPLLSLMIAGAKLWYYVWFYVFKGRKHWATISKHEFYGNEWRVIR